MPRVTHIAGVPAALDCGIPGAACANRGRGGWWTVKEGREVLCWREASLIDKAALAVEEGGMKAASVVGRDDRLCRRTGSEFEARRGGGGGGGGANVMLGGGGGAWREDRAAARLAGSGLAGT